MRIRALVPLGIFTVIATFLGIGLGLDPRLVPSPLVDKPAPAFSLPELHDPARTVTRANLTEDVSLLNVWASWCVACRQEHPLLMSLADAGIVPIYGLNYKDDRDDAIQWLSRLGNPYRAIAADRDGRVGIDWGVYGVPETFVVDRNGVIRYKHIGPLDETALRETVLPLVRALQAEPRSASPSTIPQG